MISLVTLLASPDTAPLAPPADWRAVAAGLATLLSALGSDATSLRAPVEAALTYARRHPLAFQAQVVEECCNWGGRASDALFRAFSLSSGAGGACHAPAMNIDTAVVTTDACRFLDAAAVTDPAVPQDLRMALDVWEAAERRGWRMAGTVEPQVATAADAAAPVARPRTGRW